MEHQFFIRQQNLKLYRSLVTASEAAAAKADARQEKLLKLLAEEVAPAAAIVLRWHLNVLSRVIALTCPTLTTQSIAPQGVFTSLN